MIKDVTAGEHGGWVESERNLSQEGNCWINMEVKAYSYTEICDNAVLTCRAIACENSTIGNDTLVTDESVIRGFTYLYGNVEVSGKSVIDGYARLRREYERVVRYIESILADEQYEI